MTQTIQIPDKDGIRHDVRAVVRNRIALHRVIPPNDAYAGYASVSHVPSGLLIGDSLDFRLAYRWFRVCRKFTWPEAPPPSIPENLMQMRWYFGDDLYDAVLAAWHQESWL